MTDSVKTPKVFVSHASEDKDRFVLALPSVYVRAGSTPG